MRQPMAALVAAILLSLLLSTCHAATTSTRRGLIYIGRGGRAPPSDDRYWASRRNGLMWYYNYSPYQTRTMQFAGQQFVPMLWGAPTLGSEGDFARLVRRFRSEGANISHVLGFNEPDHTRDGGSDIPLAEAVRLWKSEMEPVRAISSSTGAMIKLGSPATVGNPAGIRWLRDFIDACDACHFDFVPLHYYGPFEGMLAHIALARKTFRNVTSEFWLTEFALQAAPLEATQRAFNQSLDWLDSPNNTDIARYSYFGSFRADHGITFVGPNVSFVTQDGQLTEMGSLYLGGNSSDAFATPTTSGSKILSPASIATLASLVIFCLFSTRT